MKKNLFKSFFVFFLMMIAWDAQAQNTTRVYIDDFTIEPGESKELKVKFEGNVYITQVQFTITLPAGLEFENKGTARRPVYVTNTANSSGLSPSANLIEADNQLIVFMSDGEQIGTEEQSGELAVVYIKAKSDVASGDYIATLTDVEASDENASRFVTENKNIKVTVPKQLKQCTVDIESGNGEYGTVAVSPENTGTYEEGTEITITATPKEGYHFVKWSDGTSTNPYKLTVGDDIQLSAEFAPDQHTVTFVFDNGEENLVTIQEYNTEITKPTDPKKTGFTFKGWSPEVAATVPAADVTYTAQWERNSYKLTYVVDGVTFKEEKVLFEASITPETAPTKEGYTFSGWSEIPETMPASDVTVTGTFTVNKYKLTYKVDGADYKTTQVEYGTKVTPEAAPTKEGYTFSGWSGVPETMPASDVTVTGTFTVNKYKLTYMVDGAEYKTAQVEYGTKVTAETAPTKEGYTFSGWSGVPETMPASDVTVTGTFTVNKYKLTYMVDGEVYKTIEVEYGTKVTPEAAPTKEGYTFFGWSGVPETMPANDVTVTGTFSMSMYRLTYMVDGAEYKTTQIEYGTKVTPEAEPTKEGYTFSGWSEIPETMPANDVTVTGTFTVNKYKLTYMVDGAEYKTAQVEYGTKVNAETAPTKEGYTFSGWTGIPETMPASDVTVTGTFTVNKYKLTYMVDGEVYKTVEVEFGAAVIPEPTPEGDYESFEWVGIPETMPANDVTVNSTYTTGINSASITLSKPADVYTLSGKKVRTKVTTLKGLPCGVYVINGRKFYIK